MSEPTTAAGRVLERAINGLALGGDGFLGFVSAATVILAIEDDAAAAAIQRLGVERLARALMDATNNSDRPITDTAYATAIRVLEALAARETEQ